jgi:hypothetical protein
MRLSKTSHANGPEAIDAGGQFGGQNSKLIIWCCGFAAPRPAPRGARCASPILRTVRIATPACTPQIERRRFTSSTTSTTDSPEIKQSYRSRTSFATNGLPLSLVAEARCRGTNQSSALTPWMAAIVHASVAPGRCSLACLCGREGDHGRNAGQDMCIGPKHANRRPRIDSTQTGRRTTELSDTPRHRRRRRHRPPRTMISPAR